MRIRDVGLSLLGSAVVYVSMAACSAGGGGGGTSGALTRSGAASGGGSGAVAAAGTGGTSGTSGMTSAGGTDGASGAGGAGSASTASGVMPIADSGIADALTDPVATASADPTDGTRLKATYLLGADGSKGYVPGVWFDSMRSETCTFTLAADGQQRCLPSGTQGGMFSDSGCTQPIAAIPTGCTTPKYATIADTSACGTGAGATHVYGLGASTTPSQLYVQSGTQCYSGGPAASGYDYFTMGAEIAASTFVAATTGHD